MGHQLLYRAHACHSKWNTVVNVHSTDQIKVYVPLYKNSVFNISTRSCINHIIIKNKIKESPIQIHLHLSYFFLFNPNLWHRTRAGPPSHGIPPNPLPMHFVPEIIAPILSTQAQSSTIISSALSNII